MVLAGLSVVIGIIAVRFNIVIPAQILPVMEGSPRLVLPDARRVGIKYRHHGCRTAAVHAGS